MIRVRCGLVKNGGNRLRKVWEQGEEDKRKAPTPRPLPPLSLQFGSGHGCCKGVTYTWDCHDKLRGVGIRFNFLA